uniref:Uncharacterized protein LOC113797266 n=1 Tax=Dermatophagoides pteronyssinus TaxID=6956 RepID=A0A6P6YD97_DERPT|nr:uncharacterized protein LOC113797266 [Dermatophagoides pteronyssinus]
MVRMLTTILVITMTIFVSCDNVTTTSNNNNLDRYYFLLSTILPFGRLHHRYRDTIDIEKSNSILENVLPPPPSNNRIVQFSRFKFIPASIEPRYHVEREVTHPQKIIFTLPDNDDDHGDGLLN